MGELSATVRVVLLQSTRATGWAGLAVADAELAALQRVSELLARPFLVSIALIHGAVSGTGVPLALACDLRLAAPGTTWNIGSAGPVGTKRLVDLLGYSQAIGLSVTAAAIADEATGLSSEVADLVAAGKRVAAGILSQPHARVTETKALLQAALRNTQSEQDAAELAAQQRLADELADRWAEDEPAR